MSKLIQLTYGKPTTTTLEVAKYFGKKHSNVLKIVKRLLKTDGVNFDLVQYTDCKGEKRPCYRMDKTNFTLLAMSFTGAEATKFKIEYIKKFEKMERQIQKPKLTRKELALMVLEAEGQIERLEKENVKLATRKLEIRTKKEYKYIEQMKKADIGRNINYFVFKKFLSKVNPELNEPNRRAEAHRLAKQAFRGSTGIDIPEHIDKASIQLKSTYLGWLSKIN